jgi:hypothetical protein
MAWPGLQEDDYSRRQAAVVSEDKDAQYVQAGLAAAP